MKAKVAFGEDIRRWHYPAQNRYENLVSFAEKTFQLNGENKKQYRFQFEDSEMDKITISNERDLLDAFDCTEQEKRQSLKIFIIQEEESTTHTSPVMNEMKESDDGYVELKLPTVNRNWREVAAEFLSEKKVNLLIPDLIKRVIHELHENVKYGKEVSLAEVVPRILEEKEFEVIVSHELFQMHLRQLLPMFLREGACFTPILLSLNNEMVNQWISDMMGLVLICLRSENNELWEIHMNGWRDQGDDKKEAIHYGVQCDVCQMTPIRGIRYKCGVCISYDLCGNCEASAKHYAGHPLVKIIRPMCRRNFARHFFGGMREMVRGKDRKCRSRKRCTQTEDGEETLTRDCGRWKKRECHHPCRMRSMSKEAD